MKKRLMLALLVVTLSFNVTAAQSLGSKAQDAINRGNESYRRGQYEAAIKEYGQVKEGMGALYAQALYNMGVCYFELQRTEEAINFYRRAVEARGGRYPKALYALGVALEISKRTEDAKEAYGLAIATSDGKYAENSLAVAHYRLGLIVGREGDYEGATELFREALTRSKARFPAAHNNLGVMLALAGEVAEAEREFEAALRHSTFEFEEAAYNLRLCRLRLSDEKQSAFAKLKVADATFVLTR